MDTDDALATLIDLLPAGSVAALNIPSASGDRLIGDVPTEPKPVYSVTKMFIALGVLRAMDAGMLALDDNLAARLPGAPVGCTIRQVLHHSAGLGNYTANPAYLQAVTQDPDSPWGLEQIAAASTPGTSGGFEYSNTGFWYLGSLLEELSGMSLSQYLHRKVFEPADMHDTRYPELETSLIHTGYSTLWAGPAGAAFSTPADLIRFQQFMCGNSTLWTPPLSESGTKEFFASIPVQAPAPWRRPAYGSGVMVDEELGVWGHGGSGPEYRSAVFSAFGSSHAAAIICPTMGSFSTEETLIRWLEASR